LCPSDPLGTAPAYVNRNGKWASSDYVAITGLTAFGGSFNDRGTEGIIQGVFWPAQYAQYGYLTGPQVTMAGITDGTSNTIMIGERPPPGDKSEGTWEGFFGETGMGVAGTDVWATQTGGI